MRVCASVFSSPHGSRVSASALASTRAKCASTRAASMTFFIVSLVLTRSPSTSNANETNSTFTTVYRDHPWSGAPSWDLRVYRDHTRETCGIMILSLSHAHSTSSITFVLHPKPPPDVTFLTFSADLWADFANLWTCELRSHIEAAPRHLKLPG